MENSYLCKIITLFLKIGLVIGKSQMMFSATKCYLFFLVL